RQCRQRDIRASRPCSWTGVYTQSAAMTSGLSQIESRCRGFLCRVVSSAREPAVFVFFFVLFALVALLPGYGLLCNLPRAAQAALLDRDTFWPLCFGAGVPTLGLLDF